MALIGPGGNTIAGGGTDTSTGSDDSGSDNGLSDDQYTGDEYEFDGSDSSDDAGDDGPSVDTGDSSGRSPGEGLVGDDDGAPELSPGGTTPENEGGGSPNTPPDPGNIPDDTEDDGPSVDTGDSSGRSPGEGLVGEEDGAPEPTHGGTTPESEGGGSPNVPIDEDPNPETTEDDSPPADTDDGIGTTGKAGAALLVLALLVGDS